VAGTGPTDLETIAQEYLDACIAALAMTPDGAPERAFLSPGVPPWDCPEQLSVHVGGPAIADTLPLQPALEPYHRISVQGQVNLISLTATILRCAPTVSDTDIFPSPEAYALTSTQTYADLWAIWNYCTQAHRALVLFPPKTREFAFDPAVGINMEGNTCGWQITCRVQLDGFSVAFG
jgi:hypothetical protein